MKRLFLLISILYLCFSSYSFAQNDDVSSTKVSSFDFSLAQNKETRIQRIIFLNENLNDLIKLNLSKGQFYNNCIDLMNDDTNGAIYANYALKKSELQKLLRSYNNKRNLIGDLAKSNQKTIDALIDSDSALALDINNIAIDSSEFDLAAYDLGKLAINFQNCIKFHVTDYNFKGNGVEALLNKYKEKISLYKEGLHSQIPNYKKQFKEVDFVIFDDEILKAAKSYISAINNNEILMDVLKETGNLEDFNNVSIRIYNAEKIRRGGFKDYSEKNHDAKCFYKDSPIKFAFLNSEIVDLVPHIAEEKEISTVIEAVVKVSSDGKVKDVIIKQNENKKFPIDQFVENLKKHQYLPAIVNCYPIEGEIQQNFRFLFN